LNVSTSSSGNQPGTSTPTPAEKIRFRLSGPARAFNPAHQAIRSDLADVAEAIHHFAPHYVEAAAWRTLNAVALLDAPDADATARDQLAAGTDFALLDLTGDWAWGYVVSDAGGPHIVGYVRASDIAPITPESAA
jgi:hypothetical protein